MKKNVREPFRIVKTNTKSTSALLLQRLFEAKIDEKSHVCWNIDFGGVLEGFWTGFGKPKTLIFALFGLFFETNFKAFFGRPKNRKKCPGPFSMETFERDRRNAQGPWQSQNPPGTRGVQRNPTRRPAFGGCGGFKRSAHSAVPTLDAWSLGVGKFQKIKAKS